MSNTAIVEGKTVKVGDVVGFKCDIEQSGKIIKITKCRYGCELVLQNDNGFIGGYIGGDTVTTESADRCWVD
jgi:hypothetical protein